MSVGSEAIDINHSTNKAPSSICKLSCFIKYHVKCLLLVTIALINSYDTRWAARVQVFFTGAKLVALLIISIGGLVRLGQGMFIKVMLCFLGLWIN